MSFFSELKRRNVLRVGTAYIVSSWLLIQVAETIFPLFGLGDTPARLVVIILAIGFIPSMIVAWVFEITPQGLKRDADVDRDVSVTRSSGKKLDRIILIVLALALGYFAFDKFVLDPARDQLKVETARQEGRTEALTESLGDKSIAVLPFDNISPDPGDAYFANGMHDEIIAQLGMIQSLAVISRNSVMKYRPGAFSTRQIATELGVGYVLEGSARKDTSRTRITLQLIDANTDQHLWVQEYDRELSSASLLDIQDDIASRVVGALKVRISSIERSRISGRRTESGAAYHLYLRATQLNWGARSTNTATEELLKQALALDPGFAQARAALALLYARRSFIFGDSVDWAVSGLTLAHRAIEDDPNLPLGYYALAESHYELGHLTDSIEAHKKVIELQPSNGTAFAGFGWTQYVRGRLDEAVDLMRRARRIAPREPNVTLTMAEIETSLGNYRNAERWLQVSEALAPNHAALSTGRVVLLLAEGKTNEAVAEAERRISERPEFIEAFYYAAEAWLRAGDYQKARQYFAELQRIAPEHWDILGRTHRTLHGWTLLKLGNTKRGLALLEDVLHEAHRLVDQGNEQPALRREIAAVYAATGDQQRAYEWLKRAIDSGWRLERTYPSPLFESLHGEERFQQLMDRIDADIERMKIRVEREGLAPPFPKEN